MLKLRYKLSLFNILSKLIFGLLFIILIPIILERINTLQTDNELIDKREQIIDLIALFGVDFFMEETRNDAFGSYNILKEEYISLERIYLDEYWNFIEVTQRIIDDEIIDYRVLNYSFLIDGEMFLLEIGKSLSSIHQSERNITAVIWVFLIVFIVFTSISDNSFATALVRPLEKITVKLKNTSSPEVYDMKPVGSSTAEFHALDKTLTELMKKINELFQKEKEITSNISHELLTPISVLRSKLENLLMLENISPEAAKKTEESLKTLHRLKVMVNSLLMIARVESRQYLKQDQFLISNLIIEVKEELEVLSEDKEIKITLNITADKELKKVNRVLLFTMFYNVLNNAIKFTPKGGNILIACGFYNEKYQVKIIDNGQGMNQEQSKNLFSRFRNKHQDTQKGTGIGLAISKTIADFHQIQIKVNSKPGEGTEFNFIFSA